MAAEISQRAGPRFRRGPRFNEAAANGRGNLVLFSSSAAGQPTLQ